MKFRYKIIIALTLSSIVFNLTFGFFRIKKELDDERERFNIKIEHYNSLIQMMNIIPLCDFDSEKIRTNLDLIFRDPEVVSVSLKNIKCTINITLKKENYPKRGYIFPYDISIAKQNKMLGNAFIEYSNSIYCRKLDDLILDIIILTLGFAMINVAVVFLVSCYILKKIDSVVKGLQKIDAGDYNYRINIKTIFEFKKIVMSFNLMAETLSKLKRIDKKLGQARMIDTIGNMARGMAHDFNNILSGITGTISLIKFRMKRGENVSESDLIKFLDIIEDSGNRAIDLIKQIVSLSRMEEMNLRRVDLNQIIKQIVKLNNDGTENSVEIQSGFYGTEALVMADSVKLEQVIFNLCNNAAHSITVMKRAGETRIGKISIEIEKYILDEFFCNYHIDASTGIEYWRVSVIDNGIGMEKEFIKKIFEPFFTTKGRGNGSGMGLSISYKIVRQHGGFIDVYSEPGKGSIFSVYIPVDESKKEIEL